MTLDVASWKAAVICAGVVAIQARRRGLAISQVLEACLLSANEDEWVFLVNGNDGVESDEPMGYMNQNLEADELCNV